MLKDVRRAWFAAFLFSAFTNVLLLSTPIYTLQIFDTVVPLGSFETLAIVTAVTALAILALFLLEIARDMILLRASIWVDHELGRQILENGLKLGTPAADFKRDARALEQFQAFLASPAAGVVMDAPFVPLFLIALFLLNPLIGTVAAASAGLLLAAALAQTLLTTRLQAESAKAHERSEKWWRMVASNGQLAGAFGLVRGATSQWELFNRAHIGAAYSQGKRSSFIRACARSVRIGSQVALYGVGAWLVIRSEVAPGALVASAILLARALAPLEGLVGSMKAIRIAFESYGRLKALPADANVPDLKAGNRAITGQLSLNDVTHYHPGRKVAALRNVSFDLAPGLSLGIVGANGAGKSTLAAVLAGACVPTAGSASLDGVPIAKWQRGSCPPPIGYLSDEPLLLEGTVHENIARFTPMSMIAVARAAMRAGVHGIIVGLHAGYDSPVGVQGSNLSLRERRAVGLARAISGEPKIIVLDEPEIGLDGASIKRLMRDLEALKRQGVALIIATQDPKFLALVDKVAVVAQGMLQSFGDAADFAKRSKPHIVPVSSTGEGR
jgi:PrtD family type I secretion system ABC transporter